MRRHLIAYLIVLLIYFIPPFISSPSGWLYFVSISAWSWISVIAYLKFIKLRCATILCVLELIISICAMIALSEYLFDSRWYFYSNLEDILDGIIIVEILVITISLIGAMIGHLGLDRYNKHNTSDSHSRDNSC